MPNPNANEIITQKHKRNFIQWGGPGPQNAAFFAGQNAQYMVIEGVTKPGLGSIDPIWVHDPNKIGRYKLVSRSISAPDLPSATILLREFHGDVPRQLLDVGCAINFYEVSGECKDPADFLRGWQDYVLVYSMALVTDTDLGSRSSFDSDDPIEDSLSVTLADIFPIGAVGFGEEGASSVDREVVDVVYGTDVQCGDCGLENDGTLIVYAVTKSSGSGSPGLPSELIYTLDGGDTINQVNIDGIGVSEDAVAVDIAGDKIIVLAGGAYYYATLNINTGAPGTFTKVTTSVTSADLYVASPTEIYIVQSGGKILKITDVPSGYTTIVSSGDVTSENWARIHGISEIRVAVGANGAIGVSTNRGRSWDLATATPTTTDIIQAIAVITSKKWFVGTDAGNIYYTLNGGETWTEKVFSGSGTGEVHDIVNYGEEVIWFSHETATPAARIFSSWNGGRDFTFETPRVSNLPVFNQASRIALPRQAESGIAVNHLAIGGIASDGTDGVFILGFVSKL